MLQEAQTYFWNLFCAVLTATSSVSKQVRQSQRLIQDWNWLCLPWLIMVRLFTTVVGIVLTGMFLSTLWGNHAIVAWLWCCFGWFSFALWSAFPTADISLCGFGMGLLARSIIKCTTGEWSTFCAGVNNKPNKWVLAWGCQLGECQTWKNGKRWSPSLTHRAAGGDWGLWALELWCCGGHWSICFSLHSGSQCLTHVACGNHSRIGDKEMHQEVAWVSSACFRKDLQKMVSLSSAILLYWSSCFMPSWSARPHIPSQPSY